MEASTGEDEIPWLPKEVIANFVRVISQQREEVSAVWIESIEADLAAVASMSASEANQLHIRASAPPLVLTDRHATRLKKTLHSIETRLDSLKIEWLLEKFKELPSALRKRFLNLVTGNDQE